MTEQTIPEYLSFATEHHASDIFIIAGRPLSFKIDGKLSTHGERLMPADTEALLRQIYQMANIISGFAEHKPSEISGFNLNDVFVG